MAAPKTGAKCVQPLRKNGGNRKPTYTCYLPNQTQPSSRPMFGYDHPGVE